MKKKILVVGSTGFLGAALLNFLKDKKIEAFGVSRSTGYNLIDYATCLKLIRKFRPNVIINCAGLGGRVHVLKKIPATIFENNFLITLNLYRASVYLKSKVKIINCLCNCCYPQNIKIQREDLWDQGSVHESVYAVGTVHRMKSIIAKAWLDQFGIQTINIIFGGLFGPGDYLDESRLHALDGIIFRMINSKKKEEDIFKIFGSGKPIREWIFIDDAVKAIVVSIKIKQNIIDPINITNNLSLSIKKIALIVKKTIKYNGKLYFDRSFSDGEKIKKMDNPSKRYLKFFSNIKYTNFEDSIVKTVKYYEQKTKKN
jgi:nucleoside-diphosphate-sugar epimerase